MINIRCTKKKCIDDISLIENYDIAIKDDSQMWECHHKLELVATGGKKDISQKELQRLGLYYNRPANELIFLTKSEHSRLHRNSSIEKSVAGKTIKNRNKLKTKEELKFIYNKYKNLSPEKMSEVKNKLSDLSKNKKFWHKDGVCIRAAECPGEGWGQGRLHFERNRCVCGKFNPNAKTLLDTRDNCIYETRLSFVKKYNSSWYSFTKLLKTGVVVYI